MTDNIGDKKYRLVALDIDGTLINKKGEVERKTRRAIQELIERGIRVTLATGRIWQSVEYLVETLKLREPVILHNGALIQDVTSPRILYSLTVERPLIERLLSLLEESSLDYLICSICESSDHILYQREPDHIWARSFLKSYRDLVLPLKEISLLDHSILRVLVFGEVERVEELKAALEEEGLRVLFFSGPSKSGYMEVFKRGCSKAAGLHHLISEIGVNPEEVMAFGDAMNDLEMIQYAGCGVAMGTAPEALKEEADYVTLSAEEEGVGEAIERLILKREGGVDHECL